jgi:hypothetical protein
MTADTAAATRALNLKEDSMADIDIQRKKGPGVWPFVVGALALILVIWAVVEFTGNGTMDATTQPAAEQQPWETQQQPVTPGVAPDPYAPGTAPTDPATAPGTTDPATPGTLPGAQPGTVPDDQTGAGTGAPPNY